MKKSFPIFALLCATIMCEPTSNGIRPSNILGGADQHASFSFVRPGLTQTSFSFNGPSSHQSFSSSIGNPNLIQKVLPNVANALAYRNPGLGYFSTAPISTGYANNPTSGHQANSAPPAAFSYQQQAPLDQTMAQAYLNQYYQQHALDALLQQQNQQHQQYSQIPTYQSQLGQLLAFRQHQAQSQLQANAHQHNHGQTPQHVPVHETSQQIPEQVQLQQQVQQEHQSSKNLLGVAYSSAPSVAHVKVSGNGYKFDF